MQSDQTSKTEHTRQYCFSCLNSFPSQ